LFKKFNVQSNPKVNMLKFYLFVRSNVLLVLFLFTFGAAQAQQVVTGRVTSEEDGASVPGANISEKGTTNGTVTDADGNYRITVGANATLVFSFIGFATQEITVGSQSSINVVMKSDVTSLQEVVVIGYGVANKRDLTGSIVKVDGKTLEDKPNINALASMQGKVAGLSVVNNAEPGSRPDVRIRGTGSIGTTNPIYVINGILSDNMDFVNPSDIESIEVLKDPSSLAVFGIKGASGAIIVTTKRAPAGKISVNFNTTTGFKQLVNKIGLANGAQFRQLAAFEANNRVADDPSSTSYLDFVNNAMNLFPGNTDWIDAVTRTAIYSTYNLSIDGTSTKNQFHMGIGYNYDEGLVKHTRYDRMNININDEYKFNDRWKIGFNIIGTSEKLPYGSDALEQARRALPIIPNYTVPVLSSDPYSATQTLTDRNLYYTTPIIQNSESNPLATLEYNWDKKIDNRYRFVGSTYLDVNILKDLNFRATWYGNLSFRNNRVYTPLYNLYNPDLSTGSEIVPKSSLTAVRQDLENTRTFQQDYIATYKKKFGDHNLTVTAGFTMYYYYREQVSGTASQSKVGVSIIPNDERFWYLNSGYGDTKSIITGTDGTGQNEYATVSGLARALYNYKNKYFINASFRRDGSSQINQDYNKKFQNFWAVGAAWDITGESFMSGVSFLNALKVKGSLGVLGNFTAAGKSYPAYPTISANSSAVFGSNKVPVYVSDYAYDPNLHWETIHSYEVGFESDWLNDRLHFEAGYYDRKTEDLIVLLQPPGQLPTLTNNGKINNNGFEFQASWNQPLTSDMTLTVGGNLTTFNNKVVYLPYPYRANISSSEQTPNQIETGQPIGYFYGLKVAGIYQSYADILASPPSSINGGGAKPGDLKYADINGDGVIDAKDRTNIGNPTPDFTYGINATLKYKALTLSADFMGSYGGEIYRVWGTSEQKNSVYNYPTSYLNGWTQAGSSNWVPIVNQLHLINRAPSTYGVEDGSYFRIRNVNIGYDITKLLHTSAIKKATVTVGVQNLVTWKKNSGYSPEYAGDATSFGIDYGSAQSALPRITSVGLNVTF
jgi:TonB-linked SusC/RagA family outer membrane protein